MSWLSQVQRVVHELADVVRPTFGPHGLDQLLLSTSHSILITNSSSTILSSLTPSHPIASLICHQLRTTSHTFGDGTATLLLCLEAAIDEAVRLVTEREVDVHSEGERAGHDRARYARAMHGLLAGLAEVEREWLSDGPDGRETALMHKMRRMGREVGADDASMASTHRQLLTTQLGGQFSSEATDLLIQLMLDYIRLSHIKPNDLATVIEAVQSSLPIVVVAPSSLDRSLLLSGLLIDAQLAARGMEAHIDSARVCVVQCSLSPTTSGATITVDGDVAYSALLRAAEVQVQRWLHRLHELGCGVLVSTEVQHEATVRLCQQRRIALVHGVSVAEAKRLCHFTAAVPIFHLSDLDAGPSALGHAAVVRQIALGSRIAIHIDLGKISSPPPSPASPTFHPHTIVLCAPADGIGQQYRQAAMRCFAALGQFAQLQPAFVVGGAGALELDLARCCSDRADRCKLSGGDGRQDSMGRGMGWRLMAKALMAAPRALYESACRGGGGVQGGGVRHSNAASRFLDVLRAIDGVRASSGDSEGLTQLRPIQHLGLVQRQPRQCDVDHFELSGGSAANASSSSSSTPPPLVALRLPLLTSVMSAIDAGVMESPATRHHLVSALLSTLRTLLRIESAVAVLSLEGRRSDQGRLRQESGREGQKRRGRGWVGRSKGGSKESRDSESESESEEDSRSDSDAG